MSTLYLCIYIRHDWRPLSKSELTPVSIEVKIERYAIIQAPQWFSLLAYSFWRPPITLLNKKYSQPRPRVVGVCMQLIE